MHDLLSFVRRPRTKTAATDSTKRLVRILIDDIYMLAIHGDLVSLRAMADVAHAQRSRLPKAEHHGRL